MPKQVDHEARRRQIAEAVWAITAMRGLDAVSLREVAAQAGVSMGMVQHYFGTKDAMLLFACEHIVERASEEVVTTDPTTDHASPRAAIREVFMLALPVTDERRLGTSVWFAFVTRAVVDEQLATIIRTAWQGASGFIADQLRRAAQDGDLGADVDIERQATVLACLVDGLTSHVMLGHYGADEAVAALDDHLDRLFVDPG